MIRTIIFRSATLVVVIAGLSACSSHAPPDTSGPPISSHDGGAIHGRNQGYSILYKLMSDESDVGKILIIKDVDDPVKSTIKQISGTCTDAKNQLDEFQKQDGHLEFDMPDLPRRESKTRDLEAAVDEHELLFSTGKTFELRLLLTQLEAMRYGEQLCKALAAVDDNPQRKDFLSKLGDQLGKYHDSLMDQVQAK
jgi:hypothetical protein